MKREELVERLVALKRTYPASGYDSTTIEAALSALSALQAEAGMVSVPKEPTEEMWDAAWKSIGLPYRAKLSLHEIKTLFDKFHAAMISAAPAPADQVAHGDASERRK